MKKFLLTILFISMIGLTGSYTVRTTELANNYLIPPETYEKEFDVQKGERLVLDFETGASISVEGWDKNLLKATVEVRGRDTDDVEFDFEKTSYGVRITSEYIDWDDHHRTKARIKVMVPKEFDLDFETMGGGVELYNLNGRLEGTTYGGALKLSKLKGMLDLKTMGGKIELTDSEVDGTVETMGGSVLVENVVGDVDAKSMGGKVTHRNVKSSNKSVGKEIDIHTMGGGIEVDEALHGANVKTMGGRIKVNKVNKFLKAETMGGSIYVREADGWVKAKTMGGDIELKMNCDDDADNRDIELTSMSGDITLYVPSGFSMDLDIELKYSEDYEDDVEIVSDFDINVSDSDRWDRNNRYHYRTKTMTGNANLNGGKNKVRIKTVNGYVYLKKI